MTSYMRAAIASILMIILGVFIMTSIQTPEAQKIGEAIITGIVFAFTYKFFYEPIAGDEEKRKREEFQATLLREIQSIKK